MNYTTREIDIPIPNHTEGARITDYRIASEQWYENRKDGTLYLALALNEKSWRVPVHDKLVGDMIFTIEGSYMNEGKGVQGYPKVLVTRIIGRYKSLRAALETLRDMGVIDEETVRKWLDVYAEGD